MDATADDLQGDVGLIGGPLHKATGIATIGEDAGDQEVALARALERQLATIAVLDVGGMDANGEKPAIRVGQDVALAAGDLLARLIAFSPPFDRQCRSESIIAPMCIKIKSEPTLHADSHTRGASTGRFRPSSSRSIRGRVRRHPSTGY